MAQIEPTLHGKFDQTSVPKGIQTTCSNCSGMGDKCLNSSDIHKFQNGSDEGEIWLYNPQLLDRINWSEKKSHFRDGVSPTNVGDGLIMRPLCMSDYDKGYVDLLSQLTDVGSVSENDFNKRFMEMRDCKDSYYVIVIEDKNKSSIIGSATLVLEHKFIHSTGKRGRIEDVVVNKEYRGKQLGKLLVETGTLLGKVLGVYKMSLECTTPKVDFYESFGYHSDGNNFLVQRYDK